MQNNNIYAANLVDSMHVPLAQNQKTLLNKQLKKMPKAARIKKDGKHQGTNCIFSEAFSNHEAIPSPNP